MKKIMIMGCAGSGKSTLAKNLSDVLGIEAIYLDSLYWRSGWKEAPKEEWLKGNEDFLTKDEWIIDGNYLITIEKRFEAADTVIYLDFSTINCLYGIFKRRWEYSGKTRPEMPEGCVEQIDWEFFKYVATYNWKKVPIVKQKLSELKDKKIIILKNRKEIDEFVESLKKKKDS